MSVNLYNHFNNLRRQWEQRVQRYTQNENHTYEQNTDPMPAEYAQMGTAWPSNQYTHSSPYAMPPIKHIAGDGESLHKLIPRVAAYSREYDYYTAAYIHRWQVDCTCCEQTFQLAVKTEVLPINADNPPDLVKTLQGEGWTLMYTGGEIKPYCSSCMEGLDAFLKMVRPNDD